MSEKKRKRWLWIAVGGVCLCGVGLATLALFASILQRRAGVTRNRNEVAAIRTLNKIVNAEQEYLRAHGSYATFDQLVAAGAMDKRFAGADRPVADGYAFSLSVEPSSGDVPPYFQASASEPGHEHDGEGRLIFFVGSSDPEVWVREDIVMCAPAPGATGGPAPCGQ
jgi:hypothetical protein